MNIANSVEQAGISISRSIRTAIKRRLSTMHGSLGRNADSTYLTKRRGFASVVLVTVLTVTVCTLRLIATPSGC